MGQPASLHPLLSLVPIPMIQVDAVFEWLDRNVPNQAEKVRSRIRDTRDGKTNDGRFGHRMRGTGIFAEQIGETFRVFASRYDLNQPGKPLEVSHFRPPRPSSGQLQLF